MAIFDSHLHLTRLPEPLEVAQELHERGYRYRAVACEPWEWKAVDGIWTGASETGWFEGCGRSYGLHPMIAAQVAEGTINGGPEDLWTELRRLLESDPNAQVGEAGLDRRYAGYEPGGVQEKVFRKQAEMAIELGRDLQIHCVGDYGRIIRVLREAGFGALPRPILHRFGGDAGIVKAGLSLGALFSVHADTLRKKATREALALIPREHLLFETDADESFIETLVATRESGDAITPRDVAVMLEDTLRDVVARFSPTRE